MKVLSYPRSLSLLCLLATFSILTGCASNLSMPDTVIDDAPLSTGTGDIVGNVYGGRQPIMGADVYLYGAANTGYRATGISLLGNVVSPLSPQGKCNATVVAPLYYNSTAGDPNKGNCYYLTTTGTGDGNAPGPGGEFNLTGLYKCNVTATGTPQTGQQVWLYSIGGNPGVTVGTAANNASAGLTAALGTCPSGTNNFSSTFSYIYMNEVSTVAFGYAVANFATDARTVGAPPTNYATSLTNAFYNAQRLYDIQGGADPGDHGARHRTPNGAGNDPYLLINSLANALSTCINSQTTGNPGGATSAACTTLFNATYGQNFTSAEDTATAAIITAQNPANTAPLRIASPEGVYTPNYSTNGGSPFDLTAAINYTGLTSAYGVVLDSLNNAYITENSSNGGVAKIAPNPLTNVATSGTLDAPSGITVDSSGNLWTPGQSTSTTGPIYELSPSLALLTTLNLNTSNLPLQIAADANQHVFVADPEYVQTVVKNGNTTTTTGAVILITGGSTFTTTPIADKQGCTDSVTGIAFNAGAGVYNSSLWVTGSGSSNDFCNIKENATGAVNLNAFVSGGFKYVAVDSTANAWAANGGNLYMFANAAGATPMQVPGLGGLYSGSQVAIDGADNIWIVNYAGNDSNSTTISGGTAPNIFEYSSSAGNVLSGPRGSGSKASGYQYGNLSKVSAIAIDQAGDVWLTNTSGTYSSTVTELIGAAVPLSTPLSKGGGLPLVKTDTEEIQ